MPEQAEWRTIELPPYAKPVSNVFGMFLVLTPEQHKQFKLWKLYRRHDGQFWLYFGGRIKRHADVAAPGYQIVQVKWDT